MLLRFTKAEALGNDYILIDAYSRHEYRSLLEQAVNLSIRLSDRHFGIGGDGIIFILDKPGYDCEMRIFNADGSEAEMCGNGIRQVAKYFYERIERKTNILVYTKAGVKEVYIDNSKIPIQITVDMGEPILDKEMIPARSHISKNNTVIGEEVDFGFGRFKINLVSMGNPHCVIFVDDLKSLDIQNIGPKIENHDFFPNKTNVEFAKVVNDHEIVMRVWERGSGETMACGTGACATAVASVLNKGMKRKIKVHLLGGDLDVEWSDKNNHVFMKGGANLVFDGSINL